MTQYILSNNEFLVNTATADTQEMPEISRLSGGGFVAVWTTRDETQDGDLRAIKAQVFDDAGGMVGGEFLVNTEAFSMQVEAAVAGLDNGNFVVTWRNIDSAQDGSGAAIKAQIFTPDGTPVGGEFLINALFPGVQYNPDITALDGGGFAATWTTSEPNADNPGLSVKAQVFDASGTKLGAEIQANSAGDGSKFEQRITGLDGGGFVVTWHTDNPARDGSLNAIEAQVFDASGAKLGANFLVNTEGFENQVDPDIAGLAGGGFVVTWETRDPAQDGETQAIKAQVFDASGAKLGTEFLVNSSIARKQVAPSIAALDDGGFVIAWRTDDPQQDGSESAIKARVFDAAGVPDGDEFLLNAEAIGDQNDVAVTGLDGGGFAAVWETVDPTQDGSSEAIKAGIYIPFGVNRVGTEGDDILKGTLGNDTLNGIGGDDDLFGDDGTDKLIGGAGNDRLDGGDGFDTADYSGQTGDIVANIQFGGAQRVSAQAGRDTFVSVEGLLGGSGDDLLVGSSAGNVILGGAGDDEIYGIGGGDILNGGTGDDLVEGSGGNDTMNGAAGIDILSYFNSAGGVTVDLSNQGAAQAVGGSSGTDTFFNFENLYGSNAGGDTLSGNAADNRILGFAGNDRIYGFDGADDLVGMKGADLLVGGRGADTLSGGGGADVFDFNTVGESTGAARDTIRDFGVGGADIVNLGTIDANSTVAGNQAFSFIGSGAFTGAGDLRFVTNGTNGFILADVDGDGAADMNILLLGVTTMDAGDFVL